MAPADGLQTDVAWLYDHLPCAHNALWQRGHWRLENGQAGELITELDLWMEAIHATPGSWSLLGAQAPALTEGMRQLLLASATFAARLHRRDEFYTYLQAACRSYHRAWSSTVLPELEPVPFDFREWPAETVPERCLALFERCWSGLTTAVATLRSALAELIPGLLPDPTHVIHLPVLFAAGVGEVKTLHLEWFHLPGRSGRWFFADPVGLGSATMDLAFRDGLEAAWSYAGHRFDDGSWVRWRIEPLKGGADGWLGGGSAGGAFAAALQGLADRSVFDRVGLTATVQSDGTLGSVDKIRAKVQEGYAKGLRVFVLSQKDADIEKPYLEQECPGIRIIGVRQVEQALPHLTGLMEDLIGTGQPIVAGGPPRTRGYLVALADELSRMWWPCPREGLEFFRDLHIQVRVSSERRDPAKELEHERLRRTGSPIGDERDDNGDDRRRQRAYQHAADEARFEGQTPNQLPIAWHEEKAPGRSARTRFPWAILLGDPGIGKTTLLRYEGWLMAQEQITSLRAGKIGIADVVLPVSLRLAELPGFVKEPRRIEAVVRLVRGRLEITETMAELLRRTLRDGRVVLLLDGLDEVPGDAVYDELVTWLRAWAINHRPRGLYLTSRLVGYRGNPVAGIGARQAAELELVALARPEIERFVRAYFGELTDPQSGTRLGDELGRQLVQTPTILGLAQTPLLVTLICVAFAYAGPGAVRLKMPATRCDLYDRCLMGLLGRWPHARRTEQTGYIPQSTLSETLRLRRMRDLLSELAWNLSASDPEHTLFSATELEQALDQDNTQPVVKALGWTIDQTLDELTQTRGVLMQVGLGENARYLFLHRTFQEYLLAWSLARRADWSSISLAHIYHRAWPEILVLLGGVSEQREREANEQAGEQSRLFVSALLRENAQDLLCRPALLAARVMSEAPSIPIGWRRGLSELLVGVRCYRTSVLSLLLFGLDESLIALGAEASRVFAAMLRDQDGEVRRVATQTVKELLSRRAEVGLSLINALQADENTSVREAADDILQSLSSQHEVNLWITRNTRTLGGNASYARSNWNQLVSYVKRKIPDPILGAAAVEALSSLDQPNQQILTLLTDALHYYIDRDVRMAAAWSLGRLGQGRPEVVASLTDVLKDNDGIIRGEVIEALVNLGRAGADVAKTLMSALSDRHEYVRSKAAYGLGVVYCSCPEAIPALTSVLQDENEDDPRRAAAIALGHLGRSNPGVEKVLTSALYTHDDRHFAVCEGAVWGLAYLGQSTPAIVDALITTYNRTTISNIIQAVAAAFYRLEVPAAPSRFHAGNREAHTRVQGVIQAILSGTGIESNRGRSFDFRRAWEYFRVSYRQNDDGSVTVLDDFGLSESSVQRA